MIKRMILKRGIRLVVYAAITIALGYIVAAIPDVQAQTAASVVVGAALVLVGMWALSPIPERT